MRRIRRSCRFVLACCGSWLVILLIAAAFLLSAPGAAQPAVGSKRKAEGTADEPAAKKTRTEQQNGDKQVRVCAA